MLSYNDDGDNANCLFSNIIIPVSSRILYLDMYIIIMCQLQFEIVIDQELASGYVQTMDVKDDILQKGGVSPSYVQPMDMKEKDGVSSGIVRT